MAFDGLKNRSAQVISVVMGLLFIIFGTSWLTAFNLEPVTRAVIMFTVGIVLGIELGVKLTTNISKLKKFGLQQYLSLGIMLFLFIGGILAIIGVNPGTSINSVNNFFVGIGSLFIILEALF